MFRLYGTASCRLEFLCLHSHLSDCPARLRAGRSKECNMSLLHIHRGELFGPRGLRRSSRFSAARAIRKISMAFKTLHRAIVAAKLHRLRNELMLHRSTRARIEFDAAKFPQRPMTLGDKWDF
jgi:hypothetical protein